MKSLIPNLAVSLRYVRSPVGLLSGSGRVIKHVFRRPWRSPGAERTAAGKGAAAHRTVFGDRKRRWGGLGDMLSNLWLDLRFSFRTLGRRPLFAGVAIATLGLGVGASTTMFSVVDGVLLRDPPFRRPADIVTVLKASRGSDRLGGLGWDEFLRIRESGGSFQEVAVHRPERIILTGSGEPARLVAGVATASLFSMLGVGPELGRLFRDGEDGPGASRVVMLSGEIWRTRFGSDPSVLGRTITLDEVPYEVIGVLPTGFRLRNVTANWEIESGVDTGRRDVWLPVGFDGSNVVPVSLNLNGRELQLWQRDLEFIGRIGPGVTLAQAHAEAGSILLPEGGASDLEIRLSPMKEAETAHLRLPLLLLLGAAGTLLLVACANVANLLVSEFMDRRQEILTRLAVGASRAAIVRLVAVESLLLGLGGSLLGLVLAGLGVHAAMTMGPYLPGLESVRVDHRVLSFAVCLGVLTAVVFGLTPALRSARRSPGLSRSSGDWQVGRRLQRTVIALVFAMTTVLLVAGGLLTRSFWNLIELDTGFRADHVATVRLPVLPSRYDELEARDAFLARVIAGMEAVPGVIEASGADNLPFPGAPSGHRISRAGEQEELQTPLRRVLADYHEVMGIPLMAGRPFQETDVEGALPVAIVSETLARELWPGRSAVGATVQHPAYGELTVIGVVGDVLEGWVGIKPKPMIYLPLYQTTQDEISLIARTAGDPRAVLPLMREAVWAVDRDVAVAMENTLESLVADSSLSERYRTLLVAFFGICATLMAAVGIFGVTARSVAMRVREFGIRVALGAEGGSLLRMVLRENLTTALAGTALGLVGALWVSRLLARFLFGIEPLDPITFGTVVSLLVLVCLAAGYLPARRILRLDPVTALKGE